MPEPGELHPDAAIKGFRWSFPDGLAARLEAGTVLKLEIIARVNELREHADGPRWDVQILELLESSE